MLNKRIIISLICVTVLFCISCSMQKTESANVRGDTLKLDYAEHLTIIKHSAYYEIKLADPWKKGKTLHTYILINRHDSATSGTLPKGTIVYIPLKRSLVFSTAHASLLTTLDKQSSIAGVCDLQYMLIPSIQDGVKRKVIVNCGNSMAPDIERIIELSPDAILISPFENGGYGSLEKLHIPLIECADYMETSPLGRAEWMKFYGLLFGCEQKADSLFKVVEKSYLSLKRKAAISTNKPSVITERLTGSVWYVAGGQSTVGQMINDANGKYIFSYYQKSGSIPLSFENVLDKAANAERWFINYGGKRHVTYADLFAENPGYAQIKAFKEHNVYAVNSSVVPYFEETPFRPDYLLRDYILMIHPEMHVLGRLKYYYKVANK